jgi:TrmH family RNA methyltransferase
MTAANHYHIVVFRHDSCIFLWQRYKNFCNYERIHENLCNFATMIEKITSLQNPKIKLLLQLQQKSSERRKAELFVVEGRRELMHCMEAGYEVDTVFWCPSVEVGTEPIPSLPEGVRLFEVSKDIYERVAYRGSTEGIIAEVRTRQLSLADLQLGASPLVVVVERVEKPGNLGAILRSADAAGVDAVIVCDPLTDLYNPNLIRSSIGGIFSVPCVACTSEECIAFLKQRGIQILTAQLQDSHLYYDTDMRRPTAIVMGTEATGLTDQWREAADAHIRIPMLGRIDSLNVSVSAAILMFEAVRQRQ